MSEHVEGTVQSRICDFLPDGYMAIGFTLSVKALDEEGDLTLCHIRSADMPYWEADGMLRDALRKLTSWADSDDEDEDEPY